MSRIADDCRAGRLCLGTLVTDRTTLVLPNLAKAGFSFVFPDLMYGTLGWSDVHHVSIAARHAGLSSIVRLQNYPWVGPDSVPNGRLAPDAARVMALGADGVRVSVSGAADARRVAAVSQDWHRNLSFTTSEELEAAEQEMRDDFVFMPIVESISALEELEEIIAIPEVNFCLMSGTDLPRQLGIPLQYEHPKVWAYIDRAVELGEKYDVNVGFNTGYVYTGVEETVDRIGRLREHGVKWVLVQTLDHLVYSFASNLVAGATQQETLPTSA